MDQTRVKKGRIDLNVVIESPNHMQWARESLDPAIKTVVIGNGPSLRDHLARGDFDLLRDLQAEGLVETWAMNMIDLVYDRTDWRPTNWVWVEYVTYDRALGMHRESTIEFARTAVEKHVAPGVENCWIEKRFRRWMNLNNDQITRTNWISRCEGLGHGRQYGHEFAPDDWHLPTPCVYGGTISTVFPLIFMEGRARDVAVIGCDLGIEPPKRLNMNGEFSDSNHFDEKYLTWVDGDYTLIDPTLSHAHEIARRYFLENDRRIYNAGIGGSLDVHPRILLRDFLGVE